MTWEDGVEAEFERDCLRFRGRVLTGAHAHWCSEWDDLPVDETCPEWPCQCPIGRGCDCLEVFGENPNCPVHGRANDNVRSDV